MILDYMRGRFVFTYLRNPSHSGVLSILTISFLKIAACWNGAPVICHQPTCHTKAALTNRAVSDNPHNDKSWYSTDRH